MPPSCWTAGEDETLRLTDLGRELSGDEDAERFSPLRENQSSIPPHPWMR